MLGTVANNRLDVTHPLLAKREIKKTAYLILFSADKGLAGAYSSNLMKEALAAMEGKPKEEIAIIAVGRKAKEYFSRRSYQIEREYLGFSERPTLMSTQHALQQRFRQILPPDFMMKYIWCIRIFARPSINTRHI